VLFGQLDTDFLQNLFIVSLQGGIKSTVTINNDEAKFIVILHKAIERRSVEFVATVV